MIRKPPPIRNFFHSTFRFPFKTSLPLNFWRSRLRGDSVKRTNTQEISGVEQIRTVAVSLVTTERRAEVVIIDAAECFMSRVIKNANEQQRPAVKWTRQEVCRKPQRFRLNYLAIGDLLKWICRGAGQHSTCYGSLDS